MIKITEGTIQEGPHIKKGYQAVTCAGSTPKDKVRFYYQARGSLKETQNFLYLAHDLNYLDKELTLKLQMFVQNYKR